MPSHRNANAENPLQAAVLAMGLMLCLTQAACGARPGSNVPPSAGTEAVPTQQQSSSGATALTNEYPPDPQAAELCSRRGKVAEIHDLQDFRRVIAGRWLRCASPIWPDAHAGVEFADNGTFRLLYRKSGQLVAGSGFDAEGTWEVIGTRFPFQLNVSRDGTHMSHPRFTRDPVKMRLLGTGMEPHDFVRLDPVDSSVEWSIPGTGAAGGPVPISSTSSEVAPRILVAPERTKPSSARPTDPCSLGPEADASFDPGPSVVIARLRYAKHTRTLNSSPAVYIFTLGLDISDVLAGEAPRGSLRTSYSAYATQKPTLPVGQKVLVELRKDDEEIKVAAISDPTSAEAVLSRRAQDIAAQHNEQNPCERLLDEFASARRSALVTKRTRTPGTAHFDLAERSHTQPFRVLATTDAALPVGGEPPWKAIRPLAIPALRCFLLFYDRVGSDYVVRSVWRPTRDVLAFASRHAKFRGAIRCE